MRALVPFAILAITCGVVAQEPDRHAKRYSYEMDLKRYPQRSPQEAMKSIVAALTTQKFDYLVAQLADPGYVDGKIADYMTLIPKGKPDTKAYLAFERLVKEIRNHFLEDPELVQELKRFAKE